MTSPEKSGAAIVLPQYKENYNHDSLVESKSKQLLPKHAIHQLFTNMQSNDFYTWFVIGFSSMVSVPSALSPDTKPYNVLLF